MKVIVDKELLHKISHLARLEFDTERESEMLKNLNDILAWVEQLDTLDTSNVSPLTHISTEINVLRTDEQKEHLSHERGLRNAPKKDASYFRVPKVLE